MNSHHELLKIVDEKISSLDFSKEPKNLFEPIKYVLSVGGKRIRPILATMSCELFGGNISDVINPALGLEIFHNFTLLHDDMMDNASLRRGKTVVHKKWCENIALLSGDAMSIIAYQYIAQVKNNLIDVLNCFSETALNICEGQQYDMDFEARKDVSEDEYIKMINLKTAVLLACSLKMGALSAGANSENCNKIYEFGRYIGLAFQLQDDFLDVYGNVEKFGKNIGGDIVSNKKTYLLIKTLDLANKEQLAELNLWLNKQEFDKEEKIKAVKNIYNQLNIETHTQKKMDYYFVKAADVFDSIDIDPNKKQFLKEYIKVLSKRDF